MAFERMGCELMRGERMEHEHMGFERMVDMHTHKESPEFFL